MRMASRLSLLIVAAGLVALAAVPSLREVMDEALGGGAEEVNFQAEAEEREIDGSAWLAAMAFRPPWGQGGEEFERLDEACAQAEGLLPDSAAPCLVRGLSGVAPGAGPQRSERRQRLWERLDRAEKAEPENAAVDYFRAYLALGEGNEEKLVEALRSALSKQEWDVHEREAAAAGYRLAKERVPEPAAFESVMIVSNRTGTNLTGLARAVVAMAEVAEERGDDEHAILLRESMLHLGRLMMEHGNSMLEGLSGQIVWRTAATGSDTEDTAEATAAYLTEHGRGDLAQKMTAEGGPAEKMLAAIQRTNLEVGAEHEREENAVLSIKTPVDALVATVGAVVLLSLVGFVVGLAGRKVEPVRLSPWAWVALLIVFAGAGLAAALSVPRGYLLVGLPFAVVGTVLVTLVQRRKSPEILGGAVGRYVATLIAVLLPMAALATLAVIGVTARVAAHRAEEAKVHAALIEQGELAYYGLRLSEQ